MALLGCWRSARRPVSRQNRTIFAIAGVWALVPVAAPAEAIDAVRQSELKALVRQDCGSCHGMTLKGGLGKPLLPEALSGLEVASIASIILDGVPGQPMPPWRGLLSQADAIWIAQRLKEGFPQ
ncbi:MAG: cytochrome c [Hyphomicrobiaceae bacterium]|nr:cytochrome c [Hyphomicrobiaceae bacterium]